MHRTQHIHPRASILAVVICDLRLVLSHDHRFRLVQPRRSYQTPGFIDVGQLNPLTVFRAVGDDFSRPVTILDRLRILAIQHVRLCEGTVRHAQQVMAFGGAFIELDAIAEMFHDGRLVVGLRTQSCECIQDIRMNFDVQEILDFANTQR